MMAYKLTAIVSGGQTGADRGAMQAAIDLGLGWGGWAPAGWRAEDGEIPEVYRARMRCTTSSDYGMRTRLNVQDSDGTLLVSFDTELSAGSKYTEETVERMRRPYLHLVLPDRGTTRVPDEVRAGVLEWIATARISVLNVAGPRESKSPGLQDAVRDLLVWIFEPDDASDVAPVEHAIGCGHIGAAGFNCMACERDLCWGCEMPLLKDHEIKTAIRWCKADACRAAEARERFGPHTGEISDALADATRELFGDRDVAMPQNFEDVVVSDAAAQAMHKATTLMKAAFDAPCDGTFTDETSAITPEIIDGGIGCEAMLDDEGHDPYEGRTPWPHPSEETP